MDQVRDGLDRCRERLRSDIETLRAQAVP